MKRNLFNLLTALSLLLSVPVVALWTYRHAVRRSRYSAAPAWPLGGGGG